MTATRKPELCGLPHAHGSHWWFDGDHDPDDHWCPGVDGGRIFNSSGEFLASLEADESTP